jgi:drug/metabolite transporter (DMT)-like permease
MSNWKFSTFSKAIVSASCGSLASVCGKFAFGDTLTENFPARVISGLCILLFNSVMLALYVQVLQDVSALQASLLAFVCNYVVSTGIGIVLFRESISPSWALGAFLMTLGALRISRETSQKPKASSKTS